jgi:hypothetical protein
LAENDRCLVADALANVIGSLDGLAELDQVEQRPDPAGEQRRRAYGEHEKKWNP